MRKFGDVEQARVLSPDQHKAVEDELKKLGKRSARDLSDVDRQSLEIAIDNPEIDC